MKYTLLYICIAQFISCGTSKRSTDVERHMFRSVSLSDSLLRKDSVLCLEQLLSNERLHTNIIVTEWSSPDSVGQQFPIRTTEVDLNRQKDERSVKSEQSGSATVQVKKKDVAQIEHEKKKENIKTDTRLIPAWVWWFLLVGGLISALLYWLVRRKK